MGEASHHPRPNSVWVVCLSRDQPRARTAERKRDVGWRRQGLALHQLGAFVLIRLDPYSSAKPRLLAVVDTNALLSSVDNDCRHSPHRRSRLLRMTYGDTVALYAADHVYGEVYERPPKIAKSSPVPLDELRAHFEDKHLPVLRFVTVSASADSSDAQVQAITDSDDIPTGKLAKLIAPCVVFSEDRHLRKPGLAPANWRSVAQSGVDVAEATAKGEAPGRLMAYTGLGVTALFKFLGRRTGVSPWLLASIAASGAALLFTNRERRRVAGKHVISFTERIGQLLVDAWAQEQNGSQRLRDVILPATSPAQKTTTTTTMSSTSRLAKKSSCTIKS
jgi:hypothetical protein